jgi:hypothetical protein
MVQRRASISPSILAFFGLTPEYRQALFSQIHEIVFHGQGGYDWHTLYNMPIWLRNFTFKKLEEYYEKQEEANNKQSNSLKNNSKEIHRPNVNPANVYNATMPTKK